MGQFPKLVGDRYPTSRYSVFAVKSVSGQICGQKFFAETHGGGKARKCEKNGAFASFRRSAREAVTRSQTSRATSCATPRLVEMFDFSVKSVSGQICGQKFFAETHGGGKARKCEKNGDFASFRRSAHEAVTRSQTSRATNCATPRSV